MQQRKKELLEMKKSELLDLAKSINVKRYDGKRQLTKNELIENIINSECYEENVLDNNINEKERLKNHKRYIDNVQVGTLIAFRLPNGKVKSAKVIKRSTKNRKLKVETNYNVSYIISFDDVVWVKTGTRWPRGVYRLLKGIEEDV